MNNKDFRPCKYPEPYDGYNNGYMDGYSNEHDNQYVEFSPLWTAYEKGWEAGDAQRLKELDRYS